MKYNALLLNPERTTFLPFEQELCAADPAMFATKIPTANVQQAWMLAAICELGYTRPTDKLISIGSHADTAYAAVLARGLDVVGIDPAEGTGTLADYTEAHPEAEGAFDVAFSTSVIEHDPHDVLFIEQAWALVKPGGVLLLTTDFKPATHPGDCIPGSNERFYNSQMLQDLLAHVEGGTALDPPDWSGHPDFHLAGHVYAFATMGVRKDAE